MFGEERVMQGQEKIEGGFLDVNYEDDYFIEGEYDEDGAIEDDHDKYKEILLIAGGILIIAIVITCLFCCFLRARKRKDEKADRHEFGGYFPQNPRKAKNS